MGIKRKILKAIVNLFALNRANVLSCSLAEEITPYYLISRNGIDYRFFCPNHLIRWRLDTYFTKEPETLAWIDTFKKGEVLFDIGANIGLYTIYAAQKGATVFAFEPESQNYAMLNRNIFLNPGAAVVTGLNIAIADQTSVGKLNLSAFETGAALNQFNQTVDEFKREFHPVFQQGVVSFTLDAFVALAKVCPQHIKIDVDGLEPLIIRGAAQTLKDARLKSVLIEINEERVDHLAILPIMESAGLGLLYKKHSSLFDQGKYQKVFNYVFQRQA
ncbi:MAG: FkbM family methyltransferase [Candidatus Omnitrophica bacterium]|nr:FkbM family methyltransferase [Candidatus Omnitrophota bacterium]